MNQGEFAEVESAIFDYSRALLMFCRHGDSIESRQALAIAKKINGHVPKYLLHRAELPAINPDFYSPGQDSEAVFAVIALAKVWMKIPGAIPWLDAETPHRAAAAKPPIKRATAKGKRPK